MKTLTFSAIAMTLLTSMVYARDNDARDTWKWLQSVTHTQSSQSNNGTAHAAVEQHDTNGGSHH